MSAKLLEAMIDAAARELYDLCSDDDIPWDYCPTPRAQAYRLMARRTLLAGLEAQRHLRVVVS